MCAHNQLMLPAVARAKELIDSGALGRVYELQHHRQLLQRLRPRDHGLAGARRHQRRRRADRHRLPPRLPAAAPGGQPAPPRSPRCSAGTGWTFMEGEDSARVLVRFEDGAVGEMVTSWAYDAAPFTEKFSVVGELGSLWSDGTTLHHQAARRGGVTAAEYPRLDSVPAVCADFAARIRDGSRPVHTHEEGTDVLKVILAAYRSAQEEARSRWPVCRGRADGIRERRLRLRPAPQRRRDAVDHQRLVHRGARPRAPSAASAPATPRRTPPRRRGCPSPSRRTASASPTPAPPACTAAGCCRPGGTWRLDGIERHGTYHRRHDGPAGVAAGALAS